MLVSIRCHSNPLFRYNIHINDKGIVETIDNEWDVREIPVWIDWNFDILSLRHWINKQSRYFILDDGPENEVFLTN